MARSRSYGAYDLQDRGYDRVGGRRRGSLDLTAGEAGEIADIGNYMINPPTVLTSAGTLMLARSPPAGTVTWPFAAGLITMGRPTLSKN